MSDLTLGSIKLKRVDGRLPTAMERKTTIRRKGVRGSILRDTRGQSLVELAVMMPIFALLMCYAVDFGYFFLAAANIASSARIATQYSILGYQGPAQSGLANAGPVTDTTSVASLASARTGQPGELWDADDDRCLYEGPRHEHGQHKTAEVQQLWCDRNGLHTRRGS